MISFIKKLQKQVLEYWKNIENRLLESNGFNVLKEKYQSLDLFKQKLTKYSLIFSLFCVVFCIPLSYLNSSVLNWFEFKQKQELSVELLKLREKNSMSVMKDTESNIKMKIGQVIQKYSPKDYDIQEEVKIFIKSQSIKQIDFKIDVKHLNIKQAIKLGTELHAIPQVRLNGVSFTESSDYEKHYDSLYVASAYFIKKTSQNSVLRGSGKSNKKTTTKRKKLQKSRTVNKKQKVLKGSGKSNTRTTTKRKKLQKSRTANKNSQVLRGSDKKNRVLEPSTKRVIEDSVRKSNWLETPVRKEKLAEDSKILIEDSIDFGKKPIRERPFKHKRKNLEF